MTAPTTLRTDEQTTLPVALAWTEGRVAVVRVQTDGSKRPAMGNGWQDQPMPTLEQVRTMFGTGHPGLGVRCGSVSNGLELLEFEGRCVAERRYEAFEQAVRDAGLGSLWARLAYGVDGYRGTSPSGGVHLLYRVDWAEVEPVPGNTKLACRPSTDDELAAWKIQERETAEARQRTSEALPPEKYAKRLANIEAKTNEQVPQTLAETRGEGGFVVAAPSHGTVHETGRPWVLEHGRPGVVPLITVEQRNALHDVVRLLDQMPKEVPPPPRDQEQASTDGELLPGQDFNERAEWVDILEPHGWVSVMEKEGVTYWRRPGKSLGWSATTGYGDGDWLYVHSTSTEFDAKRTYTKFAAHAQLSGQTFREAAADLRRQGYGGTSAPAQPSHEPAQDEQWGEPVPLTSTPPPVSVADLPPVVRDIVTAVAATAQSPIEVPLVFALGALSAVTRGCWDVQVTPAWNAGPTALYGVTLADSGERKSAGAKPLLNALNEAEKQVVLRVKAENRDRKIRQTAAEVRLKQAEKDGDEDGAAIAANAVHFARPRPVPALVLSDTTTEALGVNMEEQGGAAALFITEATAFSTVAGHYSDKGGNVGLLNHAYDADAYRDKRIKRGGVNIPRPFLAWAAAVQTQVLAGYANGTTEGSGFLARFLLLLPTSMVGHRQVRTDPVPPAVQSAWDTALTALHARAWDHYAQMSDDPDDFGSPMTITLSEAAADLLLVYAQHLEDEKRTSLELCDLGGWIEKHPARIARIAALFALLESPHATTVTEGHMWAAMSLAEPLVQHATATLRILRNTGDSGPVRRVLDAVRALGQASVTTREVFRKVKGQAWVDRSEDVREVLAELADLEYLRMEMVRTGGRMSETWHVNPRWLGERAEADVQVAS